MGNIIGAVILGIIAISCFVISYLQFREKGFLFNNAYIYASKKEREQMNKKPHYRQSAIVFSLIGFTFLLNALAVLLDANWIFYVVIVVVVIATVYAIVSSVIIGKSK